MMKCNLFKREKKASDNTGSVAASTISGGSAAVLTGNKTDAFNKECDGYRSSLKAKADADQQALNAKLATDPNYVGARSKGKLNAWDYEKADVKMGGKGSANWDKNERNEILKTGTVRGCEAHHINNVANHPEQQTDPNNIQMFRSKTEHKDKGHGGDFRNPSSGELIDKDAMLKRTNFKRVAQNEAIGAGASVAAGATVGVVSSVIDTCKKEGTSFKSIGKGVKNSGKRVKDCAIVSTGSYVLTRVINQVIKKIC